MKAAITLHVNGFEHELHVQASTTLLSVLRDELGLTGSKLGCGRGECGACTVLLDDVPVLSCITLATRVKGRVVTIEGLAAQNRDLCRSFADHGGFQCGFCTPGQLVSASALLVASPFPSPDQIRHVMSGNICRCTGYSGIFAAIENTAIGRARRDAKYQPQ